MSRPEAASITMVLDYYQQIDVVQHDVTIYTDPMSCL